MHLNSLTIQESKALELFYALRDTPPALKPTADLKIGGLEATGTRARERIREVLVGAGRPSWRPEGDPDADPERDRRELHNVSPFRRSKIVL